MTTVRRIGLSFGCVLLSVTLFSLRGIGHVTTVREFSTLVQFTLIALIVALPVWLLTLPLVIALKDAEGWRGWVIFLTGVSLGPGLMLAWTLISSGGRLNWRGNGFALIASLTISVVTTLLYLTALKLVHGRSVKSESGA